MNIEEEFGKKIWWILREIKKEQLLTREGGLIEFRLRNSNKKLKKSYLWCPSLETQLKLLEKLKEWGIITYELIEDIFKDSDIINPTLYRLSIKQPNFDELYKKYERMNNAPFFNDNLLNDMASENLIMNSIILGLFQDDKFHSHNNKNSENFCIDILNGLTIREIESGFFFEKKLIDLIKSSKKIEKITAPYVNKIKNKIKELERDCWFQIKTIKLETYVKWHIDKDLCESKIYPEGTLLTTLIKIQAKKIDWNKFIKYISDEYEKTHLDWDNIYSINKQKNELIQIIDQKRKELDRDENLVLAFNMFNFSLGKIQLLKILQELEVEGFIVIDGFRIHCPEDYTQKIFHGLISVKRHAYLSLKAKISTTHKFKEATKNIDNNGKRLIIQTDKKIGENLQKNIIPIKNIRIDKNNFLLEINEGEENVFFKTKQKGTGLEKETKLFKILYHLWDFRKELKNNKIIQKGDYVLLDNLTKGSNSTSKDATYKNITRLNKRFEDKGLAIKIEGKLGKYQLVIQKI